MHSGPMPTLVDSHMHTCMHTYFDTYAHSHKAAHTYTFAHIYSHMYTVTCTETHGTHTDICTHMYTNNTLMHIYVHRHTNIYSHKYRCGHICP